MGKNVVNDRNSTKGEATSQGLNTKEVIWSRAQPLSIDGFKVRIF
jgi:hypothetical protein